MNEKVSEHDIEQKLKALDAHIKIPEIPDAQSIFEGGTKSKKIVPLHFTRYAAVAAAVLVFCVSVPFVGSALMMGASADKAEAPAAEPMEAPMMFMRDECESEETEEPIEKNCVTGGNDIVYSVESSEASDEAPVNTANGSNGVYGALYEAFFGNPTAREEETKGNPPTGGGMAEPFSEELNKKRRIDVDIVDGSVSVTLYDTSGKEEEIMSAFWVEGDYQTSKKTDKDYLIYIRKAVTREEFESGYYMPMTGNAEKGNYYLSESDVTVEEPVTDGIFEITVKINIESGEYDISAVLK